MKRAKRQSEPRKRRGRNIGLWAIVGMSLGLLIGATTEHFVTGVVAGICLTILFASGLMSRP